MIAFTNISWLLGVRPNPKALRGSEMDDYSMLSEAYLVVSNGVIEAYGPMGQFDDQRYANHRKIDATGRAVWPSWVDSHTHTVFAAWRETEFEHRLRGLTYQQIAEKGGGILNSAQALANLSEDDLINAAQKRVLKAIKLGTGALEIKSGYGLSQAAELKMLRVIKALKTWSPIPIKATALVAHALPAEYKGRSSSYVLEVALPTLEEAAREGLCDFVDIFIEGGYFSLYDARNLLQKASRLGVRAKVHTNQFSSMGGVDLSVEMNALTADHLEVMSEKEIALLASSECIAVALPGCSQFLGIAYAPGRKLIDRGAALAIATDFNPGSSPTQNMNQMVSMACTSMGLTPAEAINAATVNGAAAMQLEGLLGSITIGHRANLLMSEPISSPAQIPYSFGTPIIERVFVNGLEFQ